MSLPSNIDEIANLFGTTPQVITRLCQRGLLLPGRDGKIGLSVAKVAMRNNAVMSAVRTIRGQLAEETASAQSARAEQVRQRYANSGVGRAETNALSVAENRGRLSVLLEQKLQQEERLQRQVEELRQELERIQSEYDELCAIHAN